jgi:hypothetical protein
LAAFATVLPERQFRTGESAVKKVGKPTPATVGPRTKQRSRPKPVGLREQILRKATQYLLREHGMFLVATGLCETRVRGFRVWIIAVTLRYTTGHQGYIGDLLFDGHTFTFLTPPEVRRERARAMAADPQRTSMWHEHRASTLPAGKG